MCANDSFLSEITLAALASSSHFDFQQPVWWAVFLFGFSSSLRMRKHPKQKSTRSAGGVEFEPCNSGIVR